MGFQAADLWIVAGYLAVSIGIGVYAGRGITGAAGYFSGDKTLPWWAVCISIVATETSALTFLSIPGLAYAGDFSFLQIALGYILGRILVARFFLPGYFSGNLTTAYQWIGSRFGPGAQKSTAVLFMGTRLLADGVRLYATAIPVALLLGVYSGKSISQENLYTIAIVVLGLITIFYTVFGGIKAVIWSDFLQWIIYLAGGIAALVILTGLVPVSGLIPEKFTVLHLTSPGGIWEWTDAYHFLNALFGGLVLSMASHGTDQIIVQRILCTRSESDGKTALVLSGLIVFVQFTLFLLIGSLLAAFYSGRNLAPDQAFSSFIIETMPSGLSGLILAAVIAAAMSSLSSSVNSLASSAMTDFSRLTGNRLNELALSRWISVGWGGLLTLMAVILVFSGGLMKSSVVEAGLKIASVTYGPVLGIFILGNLKQAVSWPVIRASLLVSLAVMAGLVFWTPMAWTLFTLSGMGVFLSLSFIFRRIF